MKTQSLILATFLTFCGIQATHCQTANAAADAVDQLRAQAIAKIDEDVTTISYAFADATDLNNALFWSDWLSPFLDIARAVLDGLTLVGGGGPTKHTSQVRQWLHSSIEATDASLKLISIFGSVDRLKQDGENLALAIDGPSYSSRIEGMLDRADDVTFFFQYEPYRQSILNDLLGVSGNPSPLPISRKSTSIDRKGGEIIDTVHQARLIAANQLSSLSYQIRHSTLTTDQLQAVLAFVNSRKQDVLQSRVGHRQVSYNALLTDGSVASPTPVAYSLGLIRAWENWRIQMLTLFVADTAVQMRVRTREVANQFVQLTADQLLTKGVKSLNLRLDVEAVVAGQAGANLIAADAASLGFGVALEEALDLAAVDLSFPSSSREQVTMIPQHMVDALPGEVSKVLLLVDDTVRFVASYTAARPQVTLVTPRSLNVLPLPQTQLITITGTGFTSGSRLTFNDGVTPYANKVPTFISATELRFAIAVGSNPATWTVKVVNGGVESLPYTFYVVSLPSAINLTCSVSPGTVSQNFPFTVSGTATYNNGGGAVPAGTVTISVDGRTWTAAITSGSYSREVTAPASGGNYQVLASATDGAGRTGSSSGTIVVDPNGSTSGYAVNDFLTCQSVDSSYPYNWDGRIEAFGSDDSRFYVWLELGNITGAHPTEFRLYRPDGSNYGNYTATAGESGGTYEWWRIYAYWQVNGFDIANLPGRWKLKLYIDGSYKRSIYFTMRYELTEHRMAKDVQSAEPFEPINPSNAFTQSDSKALVWMKLETVSNPIDVKWVFYEPNGTQYAEQFASSPDPDSSGFDYWDYWNFWGWINIAGNSAANKCGDWSVDVFIKNASGSWVKHYTDYFRILEAPPQSPSCAVALAPANPIPGQVLTLNVSATDNTYLKNVVLHWKDNSEHSQSWNNLFAPSLNQNWSIGSFAGGQQIEYWVAASDTSGNLTESIHQTVTVAVPVTLVSLSISGPSSVNENNTAQYTGTASFSDGSSQSVNPTWGKDSAATSISIFGLLSAGAVATDTPMTVSASYSYGGVTQNASKSVTVVNVNGSIVAVEWTGGQHANNNPSDGPYTLGYRFRVEANIKVTELGVYDHGGDGLLSDHTVAIWPVGGGTPIVSATIPSGSGATLGGHFRYVGVTPIILLKNAEYVVGASDYGGGVETRAQAAEGFYAAPDVTWLGERQAWTPSGGLAFPSGEFGVYGFASFGGNFRFVPPDTTPPVFADFDLTNGEFHFVVAGPAVAHTYAIQASSNLVDWTTIATVTILPGISVPVTDSEAVNHQQRFYRAVPK